MTLLLFCLLLGACSRTPEPERGDEQKLISTDETRQVAMHVLLNRYPKAEIASEQGAGSTWKYRFTTNGTLAPVLVVVDRKTAKAHFEKTSP